MDAKPNFIKIWIMAIRPKTLWAAVVPVLVGFAMACEAGFIKPLLFITILLNAIAIQITTNLANDLFDFLKGADNALRTGPARVTQLGYVKTGQMIIALGISLLVSILLGIYLVITGGTPILIIGILSLIFAVLYTGGPFPLGYLGLGDLFVFVFFGPVALWGTYFLMVQDISNAVFISLMLIGCSIGFLSAAILIVNNLRDIKEDELAGKKTLAVRFGALFSKIEYLIMIGLGSVLPLANYMYTHKHKWSMSAALIFIPGLLLIRKVFNNTGAELNSVLASTAQLLLLFGFLFSLGWLI